MKLKDILGDLYTTEIAAKLPDNLVVNVWDKTDDKQKDQEPIPKFRVNEMIESAKGKAAGLETEIVTYKEQITALEDRLKEGEKNLKELSKKAEGNEELTKEIDSLKAKAKEDSDSWATEKTEKEEAMTKTIALNEKSLKLKESLMNAGVGDPDARNLLSKNFDLDSLEIEGESIKGFDDLLKPIKENKAFAGMFGVTKVIGEDHKRGEDNVTKYTEAQIDAMSPEEIIAAGVDEINASISN